MRTLIDICALNVRLVETGRTVNGCTLIDYDEHSFTIETPIGRTLVILNERIAFIDHADNTVGVYM